MDLDVLRVDIAVDPLEGTNLCSTGVTCKAQPESNRAPSAAENKPRADPFFSFEPPVLCYKSSMALSARNQLPGIVEQIQIGDIMAHVVVKVGDNLIESVITRNSAEELGLKKGDPVKVVVKSTEVMIQKE
jgi:molybdopterin-binding protein